MFWLVDDRYLCTDSSGSSRNTPLASFETQSRPLLSSNTFSIEVIGMGASMLLTTGCPSSAIVTFPNMLPEISTSPFSLWMKLLIRCVNLTPLSKVEISENESVAGS